MKLLTLTTIALISTAGLAAAQCTNEWSIEPNAEYDTHDDYATVGLNLVFTFGGDTVARCEAAMAEVRSEEAKARYEEARRKHEDARRKEQELENELARLELCQEALKLNAPRLIAECRAEGFIE